MSGKTKKPAVQAPKRPEKKIGPFQHGLAVVIWLNVVETEQGARWFRSVTLAPRRYLSKKTGEWKDAASYRPLILAYRNGMPVRLQDVAQVVDGIANDKNAAWFNNARSISIQVLRQPGTNTVEIVDAIRALLPEFREQIPPAINLDVIYDRSQSIRDSKSTMRI